MSSLRVGPSVFAHASQATWGRAVISEELPDRTRYVFENAGERTFLSGHSAIREIELPLEEREALASTLLRGRSVTSTKKAAAKAKAPKAAKTPKEPKPKKAKKAPAPPREDEEGPSGLDD